MQEGTIKYGQIFSRKFPAAGAGDANYAAHLPRFPDNASSQRRMIRDKGQEIGQDLPYAILIPQHEER